VGETYLLCEFISKVYLKSIQSYHEPPKESAKSVSFPGLNLYENASTVAPIKSNTFISFIIEQDGVYFIYVLSIYLERNGTKRKVE
jgi:hypothetical protein